MLNSKRTAINCHPAGLCCLFVCLFCICAFVQGLRQRLAQHTPPSQLGNTHRSGLQEPSKVLAVGLFSFLGYADAR